MNSHDKRYNAGIDRLRRPERLQRLQIDQVIQLCLDGLDAESILDVGTGSGVFVEAFASRGLDVVGLDVNTEMLHIAQQSEPDAFFIKAQAEHLPYSEKSFDIVFYGLVFHETDDYIRTLKEGKRIAKQRVAVLEWPYLEQDFGPPLHHRLKQEQIFDISIQAGFTDVEAINLRYLLLYRFDI